MSSRCARALARGLQVALGAGSLLLASSQLAEARVERIYWSHPNPTAVGGFRLHYGTSSGSYTTTLDVGRPTPSGGVYTYDLTVGDTATVYVALSAYGSGYLDSLRSNEKVFAAPPPTEPPPPPPPSGSIPLPTGAIGVWAHDFQTAATGSYVPGWLDTGADNSLTESDGLFGVLDSSGNRVFGTSSDLINIHSHVVSTGADQWSSYGLQGRMLITDANAGVGVTMYSQYPRADVYYRLRRQDSEAFEISPHPNGTALSCSAPSTGVVPAANAWYRFRFEVAASGSSNVVRARVWREGTSEPTSWQASCSDTRSSRPTRGTIGVWSMRSGQKLWDDLTVYALGSGGTSPSGPPPPPVLLPAD